MKNFPHQYNDLSKLRGTLEAVKDLHEAGADSTDDAILGYELARRQIYTFRGLDYSNDDQVDQRIAERIEQERKKPASTQGARTAAREMRRTLQYLGWLDGSGRQPTKSGEMLLESEIGSETERTLTQNALINLAVQDAAGNTSHPVQLLLAIIDSVEVKTRKPLALALEAVDDSPTEIERILELARLPDEERTARLTGLGWTESQIANAVKILPALALQVGLISVDPAGRFLVTEIARDVLGYPPPRPQTRQQKIPNKLPQRRRTLERSVSVVTRSAAELAGPERVRAETRRALTAGEQEVAADLLRERTQTHQDLVRAFASHCRPATFYEDLAAFDLLIDPDDSEYMYLVEAKTIDGDSILQTRRAVGQLLYYEYFAVRPRFSDRTIQKILLVDNALPPELDDFMQNLGIGVVTQEGGSFRAGNELGRSAIEMLLA